MKDKIFCSAVIVAAGTEGWYRNNGRYKGYQRDQSW